MRTQLLVIPPPIRVTEGPGCGHGGRTLLTGLGLLLLALGVTGCFSVALAPPIPSVSSGHKCSRVEMAFLNEEPTTRAEVVATLGEPLWEARQERVLAYVWTTYTLYGGWAVGVPGKVWGGEWDSTARWALFVRYDEQALVTRHEVCRIGEDTSLAQECASWSRAEPK